MKYKNCLRKGVRLMGIGLRKATSYKMVKSRLNYRWYNDEFLQAKMKHIQNTRNEQLVNE